MSERISPHLPQAWIGVVRMVFAAILAASLALYVGVSLHWALVVDSPIMHYVNFLMAHGMEPYQEITDNNMPGAYLTEGWAMSLFGGGDLGWRIYDFFLMGALIASAITITRPTDWLAGFYAGALFTLRHGVEGMWFAGEREQLIAVLLVAGCAFLFGSVRRENPWMTGFFGMLGGIGASIKPTVLPFVLGALVIQAVMLRRRELRVGAYAGWGAGGVVLAGAIDLAFLVRHHAVGPFWKVLTNITPVYASIMDPGGRFLIAHVVPFAMLPLFPLAAAIFLLRRRWDWERTVLLFGAAIGLGSYFLQQKGFFHHRYLFLMFALLLIGLELMPALRMRGWVRALALAGVAVSVYVAFSYTNHMRKLPGQSELTVAMERDLIRLGGERLQGEVQCFDMVYGCLNSLYHLGLVENTGYTGDLLLFSERESPATRYYRERLERLEALHPASVLVVTNESFGEKNSFDRLGRWPGFLAYLDQHYELAVTRNFPDEPNPEGDPPNTNNRPEAYRIYVLRSSPLAGVALAE